MLKKEKKKKVIYLKLEAYYIQNMQSYKLLKVINNGINLYKTSTLNISLCVN